jgi:hypothetical protein
MQESNLDQLKKLKELFESGAISKMEFDEMKAEFLQESMAKDGVKSAKKKKGISLFIAKNKKLIFIFLGLVIVGVGVYFYLQPNAEEEAQKYATIYFECESKNNEAYIVKLNQFVAEFETKDYKMSGEVDDDLEIITNQYTKHSLSPEISVCYQNLQTETDKVDKEWSSSSSKGKTFWEIFESLKEKDAALNSQNSQIKDLLERIKEKRDALQFGNSDDLNSRKSVVYSQLNSFYSSKETSYFDAYTYFSYHVEQYLITKNTTPTDINLINKKGGDYLNRETQVIEETLNLKKVDGRNEIWTYSTEFKAFRPSLEKYQICNIWFEVKLNRDTKIISYKEIKTENKRLLTAEEYNSLFNNSQSYESEEADW